MKVSIIICMTSMFAAALMVGQAAQSEETVSIGGNVTLLCPFSPNDTWTWVYWKKDNKTIYSLNVQSITPWTNDPRYEVSNHATRLTIKDLKKTDSGIYYCKVATLVSIKEGGQVLLNITDQEGRLFTTSPGVPFKTSTKIPPKLTEDITIILSTIVSILITIIMVYLVLKYRKRIMDSIFLRPFQRPAPTRNTSTPVLPASNPEIEELLGGSSAIPPMVPPDSTTPVQISPSTPPLLDGSEQARTRNTLTPVPAAPNPENEEASTSTSHHETRDKEGTLTDIPSSDTHGRDDVDVDDSPEESSNASQALTSETGETQLPLVGPVLIDDLRRVFATNIEHQVGNRLRKVLNSLIKLREGNDGKYSASLKKCLNGVPIDVLGDVEYFLVKLDNIPVGRLRDICEILLTMPDIQQKDIFLEYGQKDQERRKALLEGQMRLLLRKWENEDDARNYMSRLILHATMDHSVSASLSQPAPFRSNQLTNETEQETGLLSQHEEGLIGFWMSKVMKLDPTVQEGLIERLNTDRSRMEQLLESGWNRLSMEQRNSLQESLASTSTSVSTETIMRLLMDLNEKMKNRDL